MRDCELIIYNKISEDDLVSRMIFIMEGSPYDFRSSSCLPDEDTDADTVRNTAFECVSRLVEFGASHGISGNLWHHYLSMLLVNDENSYSRSCEIVGEISGSIVDAVIHDMEIIKELFDYDFSAMKDKLDLSAWDLVEDYRASGEESKVYNSRIRSRICELTDRFEEAKDTTAMKDSLTLFYKEYGVGRFGLHKAFRVAKDSDGNAAIVPILNIAHVKLDDLVGYEHAKKLLTDNTEAFVAGKKANNCLLYGDAGTGKSSSIKAIANEYFDRGLRVIEIYKHQFEDLNSVIAQVKNRNYKFIIYMDDLSFEDFEIEYKYLKAVIEGDLEKKPKNVLIYATSNRRHLINERFSERDDSVHMEDTMQEKFSLSARFGCSIYFGKPDKKEYQNIVKVLAKRNGITMDEDRLLAEAGKWELYHGGMTGRSAQQFIDYISSIGGK
ncbi:MAG: ATP-binding protein [Lachnospiraceae bacterium]|nr:ATP-binding protein [Lachnospiraceae bacterium]